MKKKKLDEVKKNQTSRQNIANIGHLEDKSKRENEEKYQTLLENIQEGYFEVDLAGNFTFFSDSICRIHGYPREELIGMNYRRYTDKETTQKLYQAFHHVYETGESLKILNWQIIRQDGAKRFIEASVFLIKDSSGKATGFRAVVSDVTELKKIEEKLFKEEERYRILTDQSSDMIVLVNTAGKIIYENQAAEKILGFKLQDRMGGTPYENLHPDDVHIVSDAFNRLIKDPSCPVQKDEIRVHDVDGSWHNFEVVASNLLQGNAVEMIIANLRDITERKNAEYQRDLAIDALWKSERYFKAITDNSSDIIIITDRKGKIKYCSRTFERFIGYKPEEVVGKHAVSFVHPDDVERALNDYSKAILADENTLIHNAFRVVHKDGSSFYLDGTGRNLLDNPDITGFVMNVRDITERKQAEEKLQEEQQRFKALADQSSDLIIFINRKGNIVYENKAVEKALGYKAHERIGSNALSHVHPDDRDINIEWFNKIFTDVNPPVQRKEVRIRHKDGGWRTFEETASGLLRNNIVESVIANLRDITERKKMEEKLREEEQQFRVVTEQSSDIILLMNPQGTNVYVNQAIEKNLGYKPEERLGAKGLDLIHPDDLNKVINLFNTLATDTNNPVIKGETRLCHKDGTWRTFESVGSNLVRNNTVEFIVINHHNITERKKMENDLRESERNFRHSLDDSPLGVRISTMEGETIYANRAILDIYGYESVEELQKVSIKDRYTAESFTEWQERNKKRLQGEFGPSEYDISIVRKAGDIRHLHVFRKEIFWNGRKQAQVIYQDITEHRKAQEAALTEFSFSRSALDSLTVPFFMFDADNLSFFRWNKMFSAISGYSDEEIAGMKPAELFPDYEQDRLFNLWKEFKVTGHISFEMTALYKNGATNPYLFTANLLIYDGKPYAIGMCIDITERKKAEKDLKQSEERYRSVFENAGLPLVIMEDSLLIDMVNDRFVEMSGYEKNEIEGKMKFTNFIASVDRNAFKRCFSRRKGDEQVEYECQIGHRNGRRFDGLIRIGHIPGADQFIASFTDITSRKQAEIALMESRENLQKENIRLRSSIKERYRFCDIIGKSRIMQDVYEFILKAAATHANVIIYGESGTGKELVAKAIHETSDRNRKNFITVNCGAIPETLMESEFFGYKKGAFTGANVDKLGYLDEADGGTLFLDEVGEISLNMQVKLLRAIAGGGYTPVGSSTKKNTDVRIIAATNRNLRDLVSRGVMREDFFYRIHILPIYLPPLRERKDDIPLLVEHFLQGQDKNLLPLPGHIAESLINYNWPGNIRELQNVLHRYVTLRQLDFEGTPVKPAAQSEENFSPMGSSIHTDHTDWITHSFPGSKTKQPQDKDDMPISPKTLEAIEKDHIIKALTENNWHRGRTASVLGINRKTLFLKMQKFGLTHRRE